MAVLILADDGPMLFETDEQAASYLEPIDVRNGEYRAFDLEGKSRALVVTTTKKRRLLGLGELAVDSVQIGEADPTTPPSLPAAEALVRYLSRVHGLDARDPSFSHLIDLLRAAEGFTR